MNETFEFLKSREFLIGALAGGIAASFMSYYLIKWWEKLLSKVSTKWATRTEKLNAEREERISALINNPNEQLFQLTRALYIRNIANQSYITCTLFAVLFMIGIFMKTQIEVSREVTMFLKLLMLFFIFNILTATRDIFSANEKMSEVNESREREKKIKESERKP